MPYSENKDSLMAMLEAFVYDPLISWRLLGNEAGREIHDALSPHEDEAATLNGVGDSSSNNIQRVIDDLSRISYSKAHISRLSTASSDGAVSFVPRSMRGTGECHIDVFFIHMILKLLLLYYYVYMLCMNLVCVGGLRAGALKGVPVTKLNGINENLSLPGSALGVTQVAEGEPDSDDEAGNMNTRYFNYSYRRRISIVYAVYA